MLSIKKFYKIIYYFSLLLVCVLFLPAPAAEAKVFSGYSYSKVYNALPEKYQTNNYIYENNGIAYIKFASYRNNPYRMSVKKSSTANDFVYCMDYSKHIVLDTSYGAKNDLFNDVLRTKIGIALDYGTTKWGKKADSQFSTGNAIVDYYMTQIVVHSLIYKYGENKSNYGINYEDLTFFSNTNSLKKKSKELYDFCCKAKVVLPDGAFEDNKFSFYKNDISLYLSNEELTSDVIECKISDSNADVSSYIRTVSSKTIKSSKIRIDSKENYYASPFQLRIPIDEISQLNPGVHNIVLKESVDFNPYIASFWNCTDPSIGNTGQEVGGLVMDSKETSDSLSLDFLIGEVSLNKTDSITGEKIDDAIFTLLQYDDKMKTYVKYKDLTYDADKQLYTSGNIYIFENNKQAKFKIIETESGKNYINDWKGQTFQLTKQIFTYHFDVENTPILGSLHISKTGENPSFSDSEFQFSSGIPLKNISFDLFAEEDIRIKDKVIYKANQKIMSLVTNDKGEAQADELPLGKYYLKETQTNNYHELDQSLFRFEIKKDKNREYSKIKFNIINHKKNCKINIFKYAFDREDASKKVPLENAKFGLYANEDIYDLSGKLIVKKDSLIEEKTSDSNGQLSFSNLLYANYYIKELKSPKGFLLNDGIILINKEDFSKVENNLYSIEKECVNLEKEYSVQLTKLGELFTKTKLEKTDNGEFLVYLPEKKSLSNVTFSLYDSNNHFIMSKTTDENGILFFDHLLSGDYYLLEKEAPEEYIINKEKIQFSITDDEKLIPETIHLEAFNELFTTKIEIKKMGEKLIANKNSFEFDTVPLEGVVFGIFQDFDYLYDNVTLSTKGTCVGYLTSDKNGNAIFKGKLPKGKYYLKELCTNENYELDSKKYDFEITASSNKDCNVIINKNNSFFNYLSKSAVKIVKVDSDTKKPLKGVEFTLYNSKNEQIGVYKTDRKGTIRVEQLPYGKYYFIETKCRNGYYSTNNKYHFSLNNEEEIQLNISNQPILKLGYNEKYKTGLVISCCLIFVLLLFVNHKPKSIK